MATKPCAKSRSSRATPCSSASRSTGCRSISTPGPPRPRPCLHRIAAAERFAAATGADIRHGGNQAFYAIAADRVQLPPFESFADAESYYATLLHELTHWTRHESRLDREFGRKRWGDEGYAAEELVAELGAAFLCADLGDHSGAARRSCELHRQLAERAAERQARDLHRRRACATRRRLPARAAAASRRISDRPGCLAPRPCFSTGRCRHHSPVCGRRFPSRRGRHGLDSADPGAHPDAPGQGLRGPRGGSPAFGRVAPCQAG